MIPVGFLVASTVAGALLIVIAIIESRIIHNQNRMLKYQGELLTWSDERTEFLIPLVHAVQGARAIQIPPISTFRNFFVNGMLTKQGVEAAPQLLEQHEAVLQASQQVSKELKGAIEKLSELEKWEREHPVPSLR